VGCGDRRRTRGRECVPVKPTALVERLAAALQTKDRQAWDRLVAKNVVVRDLQPPPDWPPVMRGRDAPWEHLTHAGDIFEDFPRENKEYVEMGDWVIVVGRWIGTAKGSGVPIDQRTVNAVRIRDGEVVEWVWSLPDMQAAVDHVQRRTNESSVTPGPFSRRP
jgi:ketosteroid isomerase-like protein